MIGSIVGDIVGSRFESSPKFPKEPIKDKNFELFTSECRFTDDTVLTCATADAILNKSLFTNIPHFGKAYRKWGIRYPDRGYGSGFKNWLSQPKITINKSYANGSMMRCSPIGFYYNHFPTAMEMAKNSVLITHNSPESIRGVQSIVSAIWMAREGFSKEDIRAYVEEQFGHMLDITLDQAREIPKTTIRCNVTAPQALVAFMESVDYESAIRNAIYIGGDTDTNAAIAGAIAEAYYGIETIASSTLIKTKSYLTEEMINLINQFYISIRDNIETDFAL